MPHFFSFIFYQAHTNTSAGTLEQNFHPTDPTALLHMAEAFVFDMYSKKVYTVIELQRLSQPGPKLWGDDSADGLIEIIAAGRSV